MKKRFSFIILLIVAIFVSCEKPPMLALQPSVLQMKVGDIANITPVGDVSDVQWTSSNDEVATVFHGTVMAHAIGAATITASVADVTVTAQVYVSGTDGATLRLTPTLVKLQKGDTFQLHFGNTYELPLTWTTSDPSIATISSDGIVTALKGGNATITLSTPVESVTALVAVEHKWGGYALVWSDEFNGTALDESIWNYNTGGNGWGNNESQYYTSRPENIRVTNGCLEIEARKEEYDKNHYTSARIFSKGKKSFLYGRMEARIKFPGGQGTWPAFWMLGESGSWPKCGEIDIMEHVGSIDNRASFALHTQEKNGMNGRNWHATKFFDYPLSNDFHVYGVEWCQEEEGGKDCIRFFVDGVEYATAWETQIGDHDTWPFYRPHYLILNLAIGGNMGGKIDDAIFNQKRIMYVDWVRVYQRQEIQ